MEKVNSLYVKTQTLESILFPNRTEQYSTSLQHMDNVRDYLNILFQSRLIYMNHALRTDLEKTLNEETCICVKLLLTDKNRTGMFLYQEQNGKVSIPGGHLDRVDVDYVKDELEKKDDALRIVQEALVRELIEELYPKTAGILLSDYKDEEHLYQVTSNPLRKVESIIYKYFKLEGPIHPTNDLYFMYKAEGLESLEALTFYYVLEIDKKTPYILSGCNTSPAGFIWINKENARRVSDPDASFEKLRMYLGDPVGPVRKDIRYDRVSRHIFDIIFNTKELF